MMYRPHAVVLLLNKQNGKYLLSEAHKLQMTSAKGWFWMVSDSISANNVVLSEEDGETSTFDGKKY